MKEEKKYPIKYAVLELKKDGGYLVNYNDITVGYIASKCYLVKSSIEYLPSGKNKITHEVVFPYRDIKIFELSLKNGFNDIGKPISPSYDFSGDPYPVDIVSDVFETFEEANKQAIEKNKKLEENMIMQVYGSINRPEFKKNYEILKKQFNDQLSINQLFEQLVMVETENMHISNEEESAISKVFKNNHK